MSVVDNYSRLKSKEKQDLFTELFELKEQKKVLDKRIKKLEDGYKPDLVNLDKDLFYELDNGVKFSIKRSVRKGSVDTKLMEANGIAVDKYRKPDSTIYTLRIDK